MSQTATSPLLDLEILREEIRKEYAEVACQPQKGFHFHTGLPLAQILGYPESWVEALPAGAVESFAGTGNPFSLGEGAPAQPTSRFGAVAFYDAGDRGCGEGPLSKIARMMRALKPGQTLEIRATDPTVATDLPAWCRMAGHELVSQEEDRYLIRHKA